MLRVGHLKLPVRHRILVVSGQLLLPLLVGQPPRLVSGVVAADVCADTQLDDEQDGRRDEDPEHADDGSDAVVAEADEH